MESRAERCRSVFRDEGRQRRKADGGPEAGIFALSYIVARLISRIYTRKELVRGGKRQRGNEEGTNLVHASSMGKRRREVASSETTKGSLIIGNSFARNIRRNFPRISS